MLRELFQPVSKATSQLARRASISGPLNSGIRHQSGSSIFPHRGFTRSTDDFFAPQLRNQEIPLPVNQSAGFTTEVGATLFPSKTQTSKPFAARYGGAQGSDHYLDHRAAGPGHMELAPPYVEKADYIYCASGDAASLATQETSKKRREKSTSLFSWPKSKGDKKSPASSSTELSRDTKSKKSSKSVISLSTQSAPNLGSYPREKSEHSSIEHQLPKQPKRSGNPFSRRVNALRREIARLRAPQTKNKSPYMHPAQSNSSLMNYSSSSVYLPVDSKAGFSPSSSKGSVVTDTSYKGTNSAFTSYQTTPAASQTSLQRVISSLPIQKPTGRRGSIRYNLE